MSLPPFQRLVDAYWPDVARLAHALAGPADGDDVAQQAWAQALAAYPGLRTAQNLRGWLLTITARCATDVHRARVRRPLTVPDVVQAAGSGQATGTGGGSRTAVMAPSAPAADAEAHLPDDPLWQAVRALPERQRVAVALRYAADLDHAQVARHLGTTPAASRRLVSDALATLRAALPAAAPTRETP
ncbi:MAG TPA: sigma-70 family RNA polymerase sigma factor [Kineosporiaceae bacterium]